MKRIKIRSILTEEQQIIMGGLFILNHWENIPTKEEFIDACNEMKKNSEPEFKQYADDLLYVLKIYPYEDIVPELQDIAKDPL